MRDNEGEELRRPKMKKKSVTTMLYSFCKSPMVTAAQPSQLWASGQIESSYCTAVWTASQLILMYCIPGFHLIQNHSGWSLKCQLGLIPGIKHTSVTRRHFVLTFLSREAEHRAVTWVRCGVTGAQKMYHTLFLLNFALLICRKLLQKSNLTP